MIPFVVLTAFVTLIPFYSIVSGIYCAIIEKQSLEIGHNVPSWNQHEPRHPKISLQKIKGLRHFSVSKPFPKQKK